GRLAVPRRLVLRRGVSRVRSPIPTPRTGKPSRDADSHEGPGVLGPRARDWIPTRRGVKISGGAAPHFNYKRDILLLPRQGRSHVQSRDQTRGTFPFTFQLFFPRLS